MKEISDIFLLLLLVPAAGFLAFKPLAVLTELTGIMPKRWEYHWMKVILMFYLITPVWMLITFIENRRRDTIWISGEDIRHFEGMKSSVLYYDYLGNDKLRILQICFFIWLVVGALLYILQSAAGSMQLYQLKRVSKLQTGQQIAGIMQRVSEELKIEKALPVYQSEVLSTSFLAGVWKPAIYLPKQDFSEEELSFIFQHELVHFKSHDVIFRRLLLWVRWFYWINPFIYLFGKSFLDDCEFACDEDVLKTQKQSVRLRYAQTILKFASPPSSMKNVVGFGSSNIIERRIRAIMRMNKKQKKFFALALSCIMIGAYPVVSYAAVEGAVQIQTELGAMLKEEYRPGICEELDTPVYTEYTVSSLAASEVSSVRSTAGMTRGTSNIDCTIDGLYISNTIELSEGDKVTILLTSAKETDKFSAGIIFDGVDRYVNSKNGIIAHTFEIEETGTYNVFMKSNKEVSLTGTIVIK